MAAKHASSASTSSAAFQVLCPHLKCRKVLAIPMEARGQTVRCSHCQNLLKIPAAPVIKRNDAA